MTVPSVPQTQQAPLYRRLAIAAGVPPGGYAIAIGISFDYQRQILFPVLNRNGATIDVAWHAPGSHLVMIWEAATPGEYVITEFSNDGDVAAAVARALERYWGLE